MTPNIAHLRAAAEKATKGPWWEPHFARDDHSCECRMILGEHGPMGGIAEIQVNNGLPVGEGGNDAPPLEEAKANATHIANCSPDTVIALCDAVDELVGLLGAAACPCCDGDGAYYDNMGEVCQCQWCYESKAALRKWRGE